MRKGERLGRTFGAVDPPGSVAGVDAWCERMRPKLVPHAIIGEFLHIVSTISPMGLARRTLQPLVVWAARLRLAAGRPVLRTLALVARGTPGEIPRQACERVGRNWREALT